MTTDKHPDKWLCTYLATLEGLIYDAEVMWQRFYDSSSNSDTVRWQRNVVKSGLLSLDHSRLLFLCQATTVHAKIFILRKCNLVAMCNMMHFSTVSTSQLKHFQLKALWCAMSDNCTKIALCINPTCPPVCIAKSKCWIGSLLNVGYHPEKSPTLKSGDERIKTQAQQPTAWFTS